MRIVGQSRYSESRSLEKSNKEEYIRSVRLPAELEYDNSRREFLLSMQLKIKPERVKILQIRNRYKYVRRSMSCICDYRRCEEDEV
jgi:hypothetical protein